MKRTFTLFLCIGLTLSSCRIGSAQRPERWKYFRSTNSFTVPYPATWTRIGSETERLDVLGPKKEGRLEGVVIGKNQAELLASRITLKEGEGLDSLIARDNKYSDGLEVRSDPKNSARRVVSYKDEVGPGAFSVTTKIYRQLGPASFSCVSVRYWIDDQSKDKYDEIAEYMSSHIRESR